MDRREGLTPGQSAALAALEAAARGLPGRAFEYARADNAVRARPLGGAREQWLTVSMAALIGLADHGLVELGERFFRLL